MKDEQFSAFAQAELDLARNTGWADEIKAREKRAWDLHNLFPPVGGLALGHLLMEQKTSYLKPEIGTRAFARELSSASFESLLNSENKDGWDYYYLGLSYGRGFGITQDFTRAAASFAQAILFGNAYAEFENIWARYLAGGTRLEAVLSFLDLKGKLADFAAYAARALVLLEVGYHGEPATSAHIARLLLLEQALHEFIYHTQGSRHINVAIEKEFREASELLRGLKTPRAFLALYLIERASRAKPTGRKPLEWFSDAIDPEMTELQVLCIRRKLGFDELRMITARAEAGGWKDSTLYSAASTQLSDDE